MKRIIWVLVAGACEGGQSPSSENIRIAELQCTADSSLIELAVEAEVTLADGQAFRMTFLPDVDVAFRRSTSWSCGTWSLFGANDGCARDAGQPEDTQTVAVLELDSLDSGSLQPPIAYRMIASITDLAVVEVENVILDDTCD